MKRIITFLAALEAAGILSAQVRFGIGARGLLGIGLGTTTDISNSYTAGLSNDASPDYTSSVTPFNSLMSGGAVFGRISFDAVPGLYLQVEAGIFHTQVKYKSEGDFSYTLGSYSYDIEYEASGNIYYSSIDIPLIAGYDIAIGESMFLSPYAGFNMSIPLGKLSWTQLEGETKTSVSYDGNKKAAKEKIPGDSDSYGIKNGLIPGVVLGAGFGYKFDSHNTIIGDLRYLMDFTAVKCEARHFDFDVLTRRGLTLGVSYVYFF
ncbi:MAG: hypothetical protein ILP18_03945 [Treponema sp.]|nr:hypothetical protein [Treponema sp.]